MIEANLITLIGLILGSGLVYIYYRKRKKQMVWKIFRNPEDRG